MAEKMQQKQVVGVMSVSEVSEHYLLRVSRPSRIHSRRHIHSGQTSQWRVSASSRSLASQRSPGAGHSGGMWPSPLQKRKELHSGQQAALPANRLGAARVRGGCLLKKQNVKTEQRFWYVVDSSGHSHFKKEVMEMAVNKDGEGVRSPFLQWKSKVFRTLN